MVEETSIDQKWLEIQKAFSAIYGSPELQAAQNDNVWLQGVQKLCAQQAHDSTETVNSIISKLMESSRFYSCFSKEEVKQPQDNETINKAWRLPLELWKQQTALYAKFPEEIEIGRFFNSEAVITPDDIKKEFLDVCQNYLKAWQDFQAAYMDMSVKAGTDFMEKVKSQPTQDTAYQLSMQWIENFERHYAAFVSNSEYSKLFGNLINSWMLLYQWFDNQRNDPKNNLSEESQTE